MQPSDGTASFDAFVAARSQTLLRTAYLLTRDHALAEDLVQTALAKAWFHWSRIDNPEPYVRRIVVTTYASWWRRRWNGEIPTSATRSAASWLSLCTSRCPRPSCGGRRRLW